METMKGKVIKTTNGNFTKLQRLCEKFGFDEFAAKLSTFPPSKELRETEDANARERIAALQKKQNNTATPLRCCRMGERFSPQTLVGL
jgi:hypothetical protein